MEELTPDSPQIQKLKDKLNEGKKSNFVNTIGN